MSEFIKPPRFVVSDERNQSKAWTEFKEELQIYLVAAGKDGAEDAQKIGILLYTMGKPWQKVFNNLDISEDDRKKYKEVLAKFDTYFEPRKLKKGYMTEFLNRKQKDGESLSHYITMLKDLASKCEFGDGLDDQLCVAISNGVKDDRLREKLWCEDLNLEEIIKRCQLWEQKEQIRHLYAPKQNTAAEVHAVYSHYRGRSRSRRGRGAARSSFRPDSRYPQTSGQQTQDSGRQMQTSTAYRGRGSGRGQARGSDRRPYHAVQGQAGRCGQCDTNHPPKKCPAFGKKCNFCKKYNHFARVCKKKTHMHANYEYVNENEMYENECNMPNEMYENDHEMSKNENDDYDCVYTSYMWSNDLQDENEDWLVKTKTPAGDEIKFKIDTGADKSVITQQCYDKLKTKPFVGKSSTRLCGFSGHVIKSAGTTKLPVLYNNIAYTVTCEIVPLNVPNVLSKHDCVKMNLVKRVLSNDENGVLNHENVSSCEYSDARNLVVEFSDVFQGLGKMPGKVSLKYDPSITPVADPPRTIPAALREPVKKKLQELEDLQVIEKVPVATPTPWCNSMHVVLKKNQSPDIDVRITMDPRNLNTALLREYHPINTVDDVMTRLHGCKFFTAFDANSGYFQLQLDDESTMLTTFNTPFGRYKYHRLPMGISSAPEIYQRKMMEIFGDIEGVDVIMDDVLVSTTDAKQHLAVVRKVLQRARENQVKFTLKKLKLMKSNIKYAGHTLTEDGVQIDENKRKAVLEMPEPKSVKNVQTLLGMVTYTCKFMKNLSSVTEPLRELITESNQRNFKWHFDEKHKRAFEELKKMMVSPPILRYYSSTEPITISCDASQSGLGCVLLQGGSPIAYGSKALTSAEKAYAQIEKELLAIVFALFKFHTYVYGRNDVTVETDHSPLVRILKKPLHQVPLRLQKMRMRLQGYDFTLVAKKGTEIPVADNLSRAHLADVGPNLTDEKSHIFTVSLEEIEKNRNLTEQKIEELRQETAKDKMMQELVKVAVTGWPEDKKNLHPLITPYAEFQEEISYTDGILLKGQRVIVPKSMQKEALQVLHDGHQGMVNSKKLARDLMYWPGINKEIEQMISQCINCQEHRRAQTKEPMEAVEVPGGPWEHVAQDLFQCLGSKWLICIDYYSGFFEIEKMESTNGYSVIKQSKKWFSCHGIPKKVTSDNGPPWNGEEWKAFARHYGFEHRTSSPYHPISNGLAEKAVGIAKQILIKCSEAKEDPYLGLLNWRNTPRNQEVGSPAQRLFSRRTRTRLPTIPVNLKPEAQDVQRVREKLEEEKKRAKKYYDRGTVLLKPLTRRDVIRVRYGKTWKPAKLVSQVTPRSYNIQMENGNIVRRNRKFLQKTREKDQFQVQPEDVDDEDNRPGPAEEVIHPRPSPTCNPPPRETFPQNVNPNPGPINHSPKSTPLGAIRTRAGRIVKPPGYLDSYVKYK